MYYAMRYPSPVGGLLLASDGETIVGLWKVGQKYFRSTLPEEPQFGQDIPVLQKGADWLDRYFAGKKPACSELPLAPMGNAFRKEVWKILCEIPYGEVRTYGDVAKTLAGRMGRESMSAQAVGGAVGHNPISIIIPCHRVVGCGGSLTGYAGGIQTKRFLLQLEGVDASRFTVPKNSSAP